MLTVNPIKFYTSKKYISFGSDNNMTPNMAILALQNPNAKREFEGNLDRVMPSNPFATVIKKIARTYKYVVSSAAQQDNKNSVSSQHITFLG